MKSKKFENGQKAKSIGFSSFLLHVQNNHFDVIANKAIRNHELRIEKLQRKEKTNNIEDSENLIDIIFCEEELKALAEMKIIYLYKHFETSLKFLLSANYKQIDKKQFFKWDSVSNFLRLKGIDIKAVACLNEIEELREVSNAIKHSDAFQTRKFPREFHNEDVIGYKKLLLFYDRVEGAPGKFFLSLQELIDIDLHYFNDVRLDNMVDEIERNMDPKDALRLAEKILNRY